MEKKSRNPHWLQSTSPQHRSIENTQTPVLQRITNHMDQRARLASNQLTPTDLLVLQRTIGNRAVQRMLGKRTVDQPDSSPVVQAKLLVGPAGDRYEQEADRLARQVGSRADSSDPQSTSQEHLVQRKVGTAGSKVSRQVETRIRNSQNSGNPLPMRVRRVLEPQLSADLSNVKTHTDSSAVQLNRQLGAKAFTNKNHIYYGAGQSPNDLQLTAHEAVHSVQQGAVVQTSRLTHAPNALPATPEQSSDPSVQQLGAHPGLIQRFIVSDSRDGTEYETDDMSPEEIEGLALQFYQLHNIEELRKLQAAFDFVPSDDQLRSIAWGDGDEPKKKRREESDDFPLKKSLKRSNPVPKKKAPKKKALKEKLKSPSKAAKEPEYSQGAIVANTHAFLSINLNRLALWQTDDVEAMKASIDQGYLTPNGLIEKDQEKVEDLPLPQALGRLKDPGGKVGRNMQIKKQTIKKWKRSKDLFSDEKRNREESATTARREDWKPTVGMVGHFPQSLIGIEDVEDIPRLTRDQPEKNKKGSTKWAPKSVHEGEFDYDAYDYEGMKEKGFGTVTDELGINFAAGPSGTIGDTLLAGRYLTKDSYNEKVKEKYREKNLDKGFLPSITKKASRKAARTEAKLENMRELATAAIAFLTNEGHHSLIECVLPLEVPLGLNLGGDPPEAIFLRQIMPVRLQHLLAANLDAWIAQQFSARPKLGALVQARIERYLGDSL